jgi:hypothetical protein
LVGRFVEVDEDDVGVDGRNGVHSRGTDLVTRGNENAVVFDDLNQVRKSFFGAVKEDNAKGAAGIVVNFIDAH